jgi:hypothetical protein
MKSAYFIIHAGKNSPFQKWLPVEIRLFFKRHQFHILHFPNSTGLFTKPTGRHYTKYRFSPDIDPGHESLHTPSRICNLVTHNGQ